MPNWKTLEAREKLLAATVASLDIKSLNYRRIATFYGEGTTYDSIEGQFRSVRKLAQQLKDAVERGDQPQAPERGTGNVARGGGGSGSGSGSSRIAGGVKKERGTTPAKKKTGREGVLNGRVTKSKSITPTNPSGIVKGIKQEAESSAESVAPSPADSFDLGGYGMPPRDFAHAGFGEHGPIGGLDGVLEQAYQEGLFDFEA